MNPYVNDSERSGIPAKKNAGAPHRNPLRRKNELYAGIAPFRRGRALSLRLAVVVSESGLSLKDIAFQYSYIIKNNDSKSEKPFYREHLADVIKGIRNTRRYVEAVEESWKLPIEEIRRIYREDKEIERNGVTPYPEEIDAFSGRYRAVLEEKRKKEKFSENGRGKTFPESKSNREKQKIGIF
ncbi:hypothetical protein CH379_011390 [Leptospira ellisii]|uniref:Uncharacterized protein n=1 Tax=Leptospira ellisii TaxID=2023197 RepID=A0A2N0BP04_9LEPT|nr:hypothetical protein [Leptospira ellisii]MDV6236227.1 hypothetical protein [Leptospira ellisii]PJZ93816.1 hypothetical protein CH379_05900 [Leptospira ellisii]PKA05687.1 hypothetical protein CH375_03815 [Leptospira ellisii]